MNWLWELRCRLDLKQRLLQTVRKCTSLTTRQRHIAGYLDGNPIRKLQIGCGKNPLQGWLNTDIDARNGIYLDATRPLPLPEECIDCIFTEHMFEHISYRDGNRFLREACRVLKRGGKIRIATPNLAFIIRLFSEVDADLAQRYIKFQVDRFIPYAKVYTRGNVVNNFFYNWGHHFIYDLEMLTHTLLDSGFTEVARCNPGESNDPHFRTLEGHGQIIGDEFNLLETIVVEACKP